MKSKSVASVQRRPALAFQRPPSHLPRHQPHDDLVDVHVARLLDRCAEARPMASGSIAVLR